MNREIKFRGLSSENGSWVYGSLVNNLWTYSEHSKYSKGQPVQEIITGKYTGDSWVDVAEDEGDSIVTVLPDSVGQFTGLKDKHGKEIYEGDILAFKSAHEKHNGKVFNNVVEYFVGGLSCGFRMRNKSTTVQLNRNRMYRASVIGNIYEHPHLLTQVS